MPRPRPRCSGISTGSWGSSASQPGSPPARPPGGREAGAVLDGEQCARRGVGDRGGERDADVGGDVGTWGAVSSVSGACPSRKPSPQREGVTARRWRDPACDSGRANDPGTYVGPRLTDLGRAIPEGEIELGARRANRSRDESLDHNRGVPVERDSRGSDNGVGSRLGRRGRWRCRLSSPRRQARLLRRPRAARAAPTGRERRGGEGLDLGALMRPSRGSLACAVARRSLSPQRGSSSRAS